MAQFLSNETKQERTMSTTNTNTNNEESSFTGHGSSSVEYFLLENNNNTNNNNESPSEILSPIPYAPDTTIPDDEESLTVPLTGTRTVLRFERTPPISGLNYLNAISFLVHLTIQWSVAVWGCRALLPTRWELTERYETVLTPSTWDFNYLWVPICLAECLFSISQLLPEFRNRPIVRGSGLLFFYAAVLQILFTILYGLQLFVLSFLGMGATLVVVLQLVRAQHTHQRLSSKTEYVLFRLPFLLHAGWMMVMVVDHVSLLFVYYHAPLPWLVCINMVCLSVLLSIATYCVWHMHDFCIPGVIVWSWIGMVTRLAHPSDHLMEQYGGDIVILESFMYAICCLIGILTCGSLPLVVIKVIRALCTITVVELDQ